MTGKQLKNSILQWAIQGKLVPQDPNDEPASVLLERIREEKKRLIKEGKIKKDKNETIIYHGEDNSYYEKVVATGEVKCIDDEIPFEIPASWEWVRIGMLFAHNNGKQLNKGNSSGKLMEYITTSNLYWEGFKLDGLKKMPFIDNEIERCQAVKGDLLVCEGGDIGRACIWPYENAIMLQNHIHKLRAILPLCTKYFYYIFYLYNQTGIIGGKGIGIQGFSSRALHNTIVPFPPLNEQFRIANRMDGLLPIVEKYNRTQVKLDALNESIKEKLQKSILQEAIQGRLVPQIPEEGTTQELLAQIKQEKIQLVKEGKLKKTALQDSVIFKGGDNRYYEQIGTTISDITEEIPFNAPISWQWVRLSSVTYPVGSKINQIQSKDILPTGLYPVVSQSQKLVDGYADEQGKVIYDLPLVMFGDHTRVVKLIDFPFIIGADGTKFHKSILIDTHYLYYWMKTMANSLRNRGYARHYSLLKSCPIPLPPIKEQHRIVARIKQLFQKL